MISERLTTVWIENPSTTFRVTNIFYNNAGFGFAQPFLAQCYG